jgi:predicted dehydrogenase
MLTQQVDERTMKSSSAKPVRAALVGTGLMAQHHIRRMLQQQATTQIAAVCEPSPTNYALASKLFVEVGLEPPPNQPDFGRFITEFGDKLDAAFIITPHVYHHDQTKACLEAGIDVLLEKPMVMNAAEAQSLIEARDRTGRLLVIAFQGSLSPQVRTAVTMLRSGELGPILNISATVWQNWGPNTANTWRQEPSLAGGGFLFDTGAHMLNTIADLGGEDFAEVAAWMDNYNRPVDILSTVMARLKSGTMITMNACGETVPSCNSEIRVFCTKAILKTGIWGEMLEILRHGNRRYRKVEVPASLGVWEQFLAVRNGEIENPSPAENGLRMARLWDAIRASAAQGGMPVKC